MSVHEESMPGAAGAEEPSAPNNAGGSAQGDAPEATAAEPRLIPGRGMVAGGWMFVWAGAAFAVVVLVGCVISSAYNAQFSGFSSSSFEGFVLPSLGMVIFDLALVGLGLLLIIAGQLTRLVSLAEARAAAGKSPRARS